MADGQCTESSRTHARPWLVALSASFLWTLCAYLLLRLDGSPWVFGASLVPIAALAGVGMGERRHARNPPIGLLMAGFLLGLWAFQLFRFFRMLAWPMSHADSLTQYLVLLYSHFTLVLLLFTGILWLTWGVPRVPWGFRKPRGMVDGGVLLISLAGACLFALVSVLGCEPTMKAPYMVLLPIALAKALLTGVGEEAFYRGMVQPAAVERLGVAPGILFQALAYALFHVPLTFSMLPPAGFVGIVFVIGLVLGWATYRTGGIAWAAAVHVALDIAIEWRNIS